MDKFVCDTDVESGKVLKYRKPNPVGEDIYLTADGTITRDEDKIIRAQRIFLHNWYLPGGPGSRRALEKYESCAAKESQILKQN